MPNQNAIKFQKANSTLTKAITELINSDKYYLAGDLGVLNSGELVTDEKYFCKTLADVIATKTVNCSDDDLGFNSTAVGNLSDISSNEIEAGVTIQDYADCICAKNITSGAEIVTRDGTTIYTINPKYHFGSLFDGSVLRLFNQCSENKRYKYICLDIDGMDEGETPFGYALRTDGKLILGSKAQAWLDNTTKPQTPTALSSCEPLTLSIMPEPDTCNQRVAENNEDGETFCEGPNFLKVDKLCVTKRNFGDAVDVDIPAGAGVTIVSVGSTCGSATNYTSKCCWQGTTSGADCDDANGSYSGCSRTVCTWAAASEICAMYNHGGKTWRLPTLAEAAVWGNKTFSIGVLDYGLMLCDDKEGKLSARCDEAATCLGARSDDCLPNRIWTNKQGNTSTAASYYLTGGDWRTSSSSYRSAAYSVRCVTEL